MHILWLDDDAPDRPRFIEPFDARIHTALSCEEAESFLGNSENPPHWVIVDLIVPQGKWGEGYLETPGIEFARALKEKYRDGVGVAVYSVALDGNTLGEAEKAGADAVYSKLTHSFADVLEDLTKGVDGIKGVPAGKGREMLPSELSMKQELESLIEGYVEKNLRSKRPLTVDELFELYNARLALETTEEGRLRFHQTLTVIKNKLKQQQIESRKGDRDGGSDRDGSRIRAELEALQRRIDSIIADKEDRGLFDVFFAITAWILPRC